MFIVAGRVAVFVTWCIIPFGEDKRSNSRSLSKFTNHTLLSNHREQTMSRVLILFVGLIFVGQLDARVLQMAPRSLSCGLVGSSCDNLQDINGIYCCRPDGSNDITSTYVVCDLNNNEIAKASCPDGNVCQDSSDGQAACVSQS